MLNLTHAAARKAKQIIGDSTYLRIGVRGGGCSGFQYSMEVASEKGPMDKEIEFYHSIKVLVDSTSMMYLGDCTIDFVETLAESGFKFNNPNVKTTCGCGQSFNV